MKFALMACAMALAGCATPNTGIVPIGNGLYMYSKMGSMTTYLAAEIKADLYRGATEFCAKSGKKSVPVNSTGQDSSMGTYATAEIQFRCE